MRQTIATPTQLRDVLRARRRTLKLSQHQVAQKLGITQAHLSDLESGKRSLSAERMLALLTVLNLELTAREKSPPAEAEW